MFRLVLIGQTYSESETADDINLSFPTDCSIGPVFLQEINIYFEKEMQPVLPISSH